MVRTYVFALGFFLLTLSLGGCGKTRVSHSGSDASIDSEAEGMAMDQATAVESPAGNQGRGPSSRPNRRDASAEAGDSASIQGRGPGMGGDRFDPIVENRFFAVRDNPLSTFSVDVDTASYSKVRMCLLQNGTLPPPDAVRIEELVNYFDYDYATPRDEHPFAVHLETAGCPWQPAHRLMRIGIQGQRIETERPRCNLVFLLDVSGSMNRGNKLPLVKESMRMLVERLDEGDRVAIVVYASASGLVLPSTPASEQQRILAALNQLHAGGSTNGGEGIRLAYQVALDNFIDGGVNRVILCSDGDFNVGVTSTGDLVKMAEQRASQGVYLSVFGFGVGNHNDAMLEQISNRGNGNYAFIDTQREAFKLFVRQLSGTLITIAKDVKIQVEFDPAHVAGYRLIGYENRLLAARDFNDDRKDAGEIGAGHRVTALYELVPAGADSGALPPLVDPLKYQHDSADSEVAADSDVVADPEWLTVKLRYKSPDADQSQRMEITATGSDQDIQQASASFRLAAAVASFGMLLRHSDHCGDAGYGMSYALAESACGEDRHGDGAELLEMIRTAAELSGEQLSATTFSMFPLGTPTETTALFASTSSYAASGVEHVWLVLGALGAISTMVLAAGLLVAFVLRPQLEYQQIPNSKQLDI